MSKCDRCGYIKWVNPLEPLAFGANSAALFFFLRNVTPSTEPFLGAEHFYHNWHALLLYLTGGYAGWCAVFFVLFSIGWIAGIDPNHKPAASGE